MNRGVYVVLRVFSLLLTVCVLSPILYEKYRISVEAQSLMHPSPQGILSPRHQSCDLNLSASRRTHSSKRVMCFACLFSLEGKNACK